MDWQNQYCKNSILPKVIYTFNAFPIKVAMTFTTEIEKSVLEFIWNHKRLQIVKVILSKNSHTGDFTIRNIKLHYRATEIQIS
jgi:putative lipoic acid-binding regulatory protein